MDDDIFLEHSGVRFTGIAFNNAYEYFNQIVDEDTIRRIEIYMTQSRAESKLFKVCHSFDD